MPAAWPEWQCRAGRSNRDFLTYVDGFHEVLPHGGGSRFWQPSKASVVTFPYAEVMFLSPLAVCSGHVLQPRPCLEASFRQMVCSFDPSLPPRSVYSLRYSHTAPTRQRAVNHFHEKCPGNLIENRVLFLRKVSRSSALKEFPVEGEMTHAAGVECYYHVIAGEEELDLERIIAEGPQLRGLCSSGGSSNQSVS
jgi:hypothetical protein